jgi:hypothetical protein
MELNIMAQNVKTKKPSQDTIDSLFQEISDDLMESINGGQGNCHYQIIMEPITMPQDNTRVVLPIRN